MPMLFTFQYGGIKQPPAFLVDLDQVNLHSSMVGLNPASLMKTSFQNCIYIPVWWD